MQRQGDTINSFPETVNVEEGPSPDNASIGQPNSLGNLLTPLETRSSNYTVPSGETHGNTLTPDVRILSGWNSGEPSSRVRLQNQLNRDMLNHQLDDDGTKVEHGWSTYGTHAGDAQRSEERRVEPLNVFFPGRLNNGHIVNQIRNAPVYFEGSSSNHGPLSVNLTEGFISRRGAGGSGVGSGMDHNPHNSVGSEREKVSNASVSYNVGSSSGISNYKGEEIDDGSGSSLGSWGLSCKRKALEGTSRQSYSASTSSYSEQIENVAMRAIPARTDASSHMGLPTPSRNLLNVSPTDQLDMRGVVSDAFPSSSARSASQGSRQECSLYSLSSTGVAGQSTFGSPSHPSAAPFGDSRDLRSTEAIAENFSSPSSQPCTRTVSIVPRNVHPFPWNGTSSSRAGNPSGSTNPVERAAAAYREEPNIRNISRSNVEHPMFELETEMRHVAQNPTGWSLATENNISTSGSVPSSNRPGHSSSIPSLPTPSWVPPQNPPIQYQQRLSEFAPWSLFPPFDSESGNNTGYFLSLSSGGPSASSQETRVPSRSNSQGNNRTYPRSALMLERQGDNVLGMPHSLRALAVDIEGRHRLLSEIRQVLTVMRRGENLQIEDYTMFDPFIYHGMVETHDRHRDMRLDVDNMSYEELLALGEHIGDVSTGLNEETILKLMKQHKYSSITTEFTQESEPCCICQEEYVDGEDTGTLDCGHDFHTNCIKQWLMLKNLCPVCKTTGLLK
ncbi:cell wall protein AWA1-like isoform X3 [Hibiscus syriacus]|uniref:RING-type E3 ubiquitin transferase n=1 Tax=Hibiscus syriacus TaxID=106335 RepID=A0A6A3B4M3_HIBSY|nr:E3 ubiquitin-protein ligase MBR2-like [Hibiscus syriacus]KAE8711736.1 cell wall protein AWA1-like isoform X3 [Hibiscus syriacus]